MNNLQYEKKMTDTELEKKPKKIHKKMQIVFGIAGILTILTATLIPLSFHISKVKQYNRGVTFLENQEYEEALECFSSLGTFDDSEKMAEYAQMELDYRSLDDSVDSGDYANVIQILRKRSEFYGNSDVGKEAEALAYEYEAVSKALAAKKSGDYERAVKLLDGLTVLKNNYSMEICMCNAYIAQNEQNWMDMIYNLYAVQSGDYALGFLSDPQNDDEIFLSTADIRDDKTAETVSEILQTNDSETEQLKRFALNGLRYDAAKEQLDFGNYETAMESFLELGDFLDSAVLYEDAKNAYESLETSYLQAEDYYANGEYYKAKQLYLSLNDYKDSAEKANSCLQPLPASGALKQGNGFACKLQIAVPDDFRYTFLKLYDSGETPIGQVFIHPGKRASISMASGTYTIKVAYGTNWYGEIDLFGDDGSYQQLINGSSTIFELESGYAYTLTLGGVVDGTVGTKNIGGADGM